MNVIMSTTNAMRFSPGHLTIGKYCRALAKHRRTALRGAFNGRRSAFRWETEDIRSWRGAKCYDAMHRDLSYCSWCSTSTIAMRTTIGHTFGAGRVPSESIYLLHCQSAADKQVRYRSSHLRPEVPSAVWTRCNTLWSLVPPLHETYMRVPSMMYHHAPVYRRGSCCVPTYQHWIQSGRGHTGR